MIHLIRAFYKGMREFRCVFTWHYETHNESRAYDLGRELAHRLTFRRYES